VRAVTVQSSMTSAATFTPGQQPHPRRVLVFAIPRSAAAAGRLTLVGIIVGIAGALVVSRLMRQALFEVDPADPLVYLVLSVTLLLVAECASFFPARRATRIDAVIALRTE